MTLTTNSDVGQTIGLCRLLPRACGPQNCMKNRCAVLSRLVGRTSRSAPGLLTRQASGAGTPRADQEVRPTVRLPGFSSSVTCLGQARQTTKGDGLSHRFGT